jgi:hypothetical protein
MIVGMTRALYTDINSAGRGWLRRLWQDSKAPLQRVGSPGQLFAFRRDPTGNLLRMAEKSGDVVHMRFGPRNDHLLSNPSDTGRGCLTINGE